MKTKQILTLNKYIDKNSNLLIFLLCLLGVLIPALSGRAGTNMWEKYSLILTSSFFNTMFSLALLIIMITVSQKLSTNYFYISRYSKYSFLIKTNIKALIIITIMTYMISQILILGGAVLFSFGNNSLIADPNYKIPIVMYILFQIIKGTVFYCFIATIMYLLSILLKKRASQILIVLLSLLYFILPEIERVEHFYQLPWLYHYYLVNVKYTTLFVECICSVLYGFILYGFIKLLYKKAISNKRDLI